MFKLRLHLNGAEVKTITLEPGNAYTAGRSSSCEIQLGDHPGISRQHFKLYEEGGVWRLQVVSKFGEVISNGETVTDIELTDGSMFKVPPYDFFFVGSEEQLSSTHEIRQNDEFVPAANPPAVAQAYNASGEAASSENPWETNEATFVAQSVSVPYIRIVSDTDGSEETLRLEGSAWVAGRDETSDIQLNDTKSSRRHFEISVSDNGYTICDLGSSNGTLLNGSKLKSNEPTPIRSGDVIGVGSTTMHFEIRDPNFKNKLVVIPKQLTQLPTVPGDDLGMMMPYPVHGQGGVVPLDASGMPLPTNKKIGGLDFSQPRTKIFATVAALLIVIAFIFGGGESSKNAPTGKNASDDPKILAFQKLPEPQKKLVRDTYQMAYNLYLGQKFELSAQQIDKIHMILPEGYEESHKLREEIKEKENDRLRLIALEEEKRRLEENQRRVEQTIVNCQPLVRTAQDVSQIQDCLSEAISLDPENTRIQEMIATVQQRLDDLKIKQASKAEYARAIARGRSLREKAEKVDASGDVLGAIAAWENVLKASFPDPDGIKDIATERVRTLRGGIDKEVSRRLASAERKFNDGKHKEAYIDVQKAKKVDPQNPKISELTDRIVRDLNAQLQAIYSDSVLEEGLGNIESAKEKWRKMLEIDRPDGEYYRRAQSKLRQYGSAK